MRTVKQVSTYEGGYEYDLYNVRLGKCAVSVFFFLIMNCMLKILQKMATLYTFIDWFLVSIYIG